MGFILSLALGYWSLFPYISSSPQRAHVQIGPLRPCQVLRLSSVFPGYHGPPTWMFFSDFGLGIGNQPQAHLDSTCKKNTKASEVNRHCLSSVIVLCGRSHRQWSTISHILENHLSRTGIRYDAAHAQKTLIFRAFVVLLAGGLFSRHAQKRP